MRIVVALLVVFAGILTSFSNRPSRILIIGDSISIGYFPFVKKTLESEAEIIHNPGNAENTTTGLDSIQKWLGIEHWDVIQFNWGLWDLCYRSSESKAYGRRDKINGVQDNSPEDYSKKLEKLVVLLNQTKAKLIFVTTTAVPEEEPGRNVKDVELYNSIARKIMKKYKVAVNDLYKPSIAIHKEYGLGNNDVHYNKEGYEKLSGYVSRYLKKYLN